MTRDLRNPRMIRRGFPRPFIRYDRESGQVFHETLYTIAPDHDKNWPNYRRASQLPDFLEGLQEVKDGHEAVPRYSKFVEQRRIARPASITGTRSLQDSVAEFIMRHLDKMTPEQLQILPEHVVLSIWETLNERNIVNLQTWTIFSRLLHKADKATVGLYRYRLALPVPLSPLQVYTNPLTSTNFHFLTYLSLTTMFSFAQLVKISDMPNIGILEIVRPHSEIPCSSFTGVRDRLVRAWSEAAVARGAFSVLRILKLWNHSDITDESLTYLNRFPALAVFDVKHCSITSKGGAIAISGGWTKIGTSASVLLEKECAKREADMRDSADLSPKPRPSFNPLVNSEPVVRISDKDIEKLRFGDLNLSNLTTNRVDISVARKAWYDLEMDAFREERMPKTWEFKAFTAFARIGELRGDVDLEIAGIPKTKISVMAGDGLICPIPMACLRLGPLGRAKPITRFHSRTYNPYPEESDDENWLFLRTSMPTTDKNSKPSTTVDQASSDGNVLSKTTNSKAVKIRPRKQQKVSDLLNSFN